MITPITRPWLDPRVDDSVAVAVKVTVGGDCVLDGRGEGVVVGGPGVSVGVAGGVMSSSNLWSA